MVDQTCSLAVVPAASITPEQLTTGTLSGTGVFDRLMGAVKAHIQEEFDASRIKGTEYATVYLGSIQTVLQQAMTFVLQEQVNEKQIELLSHQIISEQKAQCKLDAEYDLLMAQIRKVEAETALITQKKVTEQAQTSATAVDEDSVIGRQKGLYAAQTEGYSRDAEQKAAKLVLDIIATQIATTGAEVPSTSALTTGNVDAKILEPLLQKAGLTSA